MHYLRKFLGKYRVKAEYDLKTNDFPRDDNGIDPSFDDLYIECKSNIKIKHGVGNVLSCYIPSKQKGTNILKQIYTDKISDKFPKESSAVEKRYYENLCAELIKSDVLVSAEVLDFEVYFEFKSNMIDYIADLVGAKTNGANISPFSVKNLKKTAYTIPEEDLELYTAAIEHFPRKEMVVKGKPRTVVDGLAIKSANTQFDQIISKQMPKGFNILEDKRYKGLKSKEYVHSLGDDMWRQYCDFLEQF